MLSIASITTDWSLITRPDELEPVRVMCDAITYEAISKFCRFNVTLKTYLASDYIQRVVQIRDYLAATLLPRVRRKLERKYVQVLASRRLPRSRVSEGKNRSKSRSLTADMHQSPCKSVATTLD